MERDKKIWLIEQYAQKAWMVSLTLSQEAARAGQNGKGYAVVAHEARMLADRMYEYVAEVRFGSGSENTFKGIIKFAVMLKYLSVNAALEIMHMVDISMDFNIPKSMAVFAEELRRIAVALNELADNDLRKKPFVIPEFASPSEVAGTSSYFLYSIAGHPLIENTKNVIEIHTAFPGAITEGKPHPIRGKDIPIIDCYRLLDLPYTGSEDSQTLMIVSPHGRKIGHADEIYAVPIDDLDVNAIFYSRAGRAVPPNDNHAFAGYSRECWDVIGGDQVVFVDWEKLVQ
jgi:hypothetical protein